MLSAEQIAERLGGPLRLLSVGFRTATPRHQTLRATLDWSYELLSEPERKLFERLSAFAGGWTLEAAEAVGAGSVIAEGDVLDLLGGLLDKSLVVAAANEEGSPRYRLLEPVRHYGAEKLTLSGDESESRKRHADFFVKLAEEAESELKGPRQVLWVRMLSGERDNLRAAMRWLLGRGEWEAAVRLGWALWLFWWIRGLFTEGRRWMEEVLAKGGAMQPSTRAKASYVAGTMAAGQADYRAAEPLLEQSLGLFRELGNKRGAAYVLVTSGILTLCQRRHEQGSPSSKRVQNSTSKQGTGSAPPRRSLSRRWGGPNWVITGALRGWRSADWRSIGR